MSNHSSFASGKPLTREQREKLQKDVAKDWNALFDRIWIGYTKVTFLDVALSIVKRSILPLALTCGAWFFFQKSPKYLSPFARLSWMQPSHEYYNFSLGALSFGIATLLTTVWDSIVNAPRKTIQSALVDEDSTMLLENKDVKYSPLIRSSRTLDLMSTFRGASTIRELWDNAVATYSSSPCMYYRNLVRFIDQAEETSDPKASPRMLRKVVLENFANKETFAQVDKRVKYAGAGLHHLITTDHTGKPLSSPPKLRHVGIFAETKREWMISLQGATRYGMTVVTAYATLGEDALSYSMDLTQVRVMIVDDELLPKLRSILFGRNITLESGEVRRVDGSQISAVVYIPSIHGAVPDTSILDELKNRSPELGGPVRILSFEELENLGRSHLIEAVDGEKPAKVPHVIVPTPEDLALIMFTSGTTGLPKGVEIMHMNIVAAVAGIGGMVPGIGPRDTYLAYLPLAHVLEVVAENALLAHGGSLAYGSPRTLSESGTSIPKPSPAKPDGTPAVPKVESDLVVYAPTLLAGVPAVFERILKGIQHKVAGLSPVGRFVFNFAYKTKLAALKNNQTTPLLDFLIFQPLRAKALGPHARLRGCMSGGGPISRDTQEFISVCIAPCLQGYGLTETAAAGAFSWLTDTLYGRAGAPPLCADLRLVDWEEGGYKHTNSPSRGEVLIGGPAVARGYYMEPEKTKKDFVQDSTGKRWFATGDIGEIHAEGALRIIDRKKDLVKLAHGEYISLGKVESILSSCCPSIAQIMVCANSLKSHAIALVVPSVPYFSHHSEVSESTRQAAKSQGLAGLQLVDEVKSIIMGQIRDSRKGGKLFAFEIPAKIHVCGEEWLAQDGLLTESLKLKRAALSEKYKQEIAHTYAS